MGIARTHAVELRGFTEEPVLEEEHELFPKASKRMNGEQSRRGAHELETPSPEAGAPQR
jgi:hypothetical protein